MVVCAAVLIAAFAAFLFTHRSVDVVLTRDRLQSEIDKRLPYERILPKVAYIVRQADLTFVGGGRIGLAVDAEATVLGRRFSFRLTGSGAPDYRDGGFYVRDFALTDAAFAGAQRLNDSALLARVRETVGEHLAVWLEDRPVFKLEPDDTRRFLTRLLLVSIRAQDGAMIATLDPLAAIGNIAWTALLAAGAMLVALAGLLAPGSDRRISAVRGI